MNDNTTIMNDNDTPIIPAISTTIEFLFSLNSFVWIMPRLFTNVVVPFLYWSTVAVLGYYLANVVDIRLPTAEQFHHLSDGMFDSPLDADGFKRFFGVDPIVASKIWRELYYKSRCFYFAGLHGLKPVHLLWTLLYLHNYNQREMLANSMGVSIDEFRKWSWFYLTEIAKLTDNYVNWEDRFIGKRQYDAAGPFVTIAVLECPLLNVPFDIDYPVHKLLYEIAICIRTGHVVSFSGPFDEMPGVNVFRSGLKRLLDRFEQVAVSADMEGYHKDKRVLICEDAARARHEMFFARLKAWGVIGTTFRETADKHRIAFRAVLAVEHFCGEIHGEYIQDNDIVDID